MEERNIQSVKVQIIQASSLIRGLMSDVQVQQIIVAFTILRRIDCLIGKYATKSAEFYANNGKTLSEERLAEKLCEISGGYPFYNYSGYNFERILMSPESIEVVMNSYFQGFSDNVLDTLDGMNFIQNLAMLQRQSRYLVDLIEFLAQQDLSEGSVDNEEFLELISFIFDAWGDLSGVFNTSYALSDLISGCLLSEDLRVGKEDYVSIYDPVCGTGGLLATAGLKAKTFAIHQSNICLYGQEIDVFTSAVAKALVLLSGNEHSEVRYGNTLTDDRFSDMHFHYILADMPLGLHWKSIKERIETESIDPSGRFSIGLPSIVDSQFLFIEHIISKMDKCGSRAAFMTTGTILAAGGATSGESRIRRWLFEKDMIETIIALPGGVLSFSNIPVYLWILTNKKKDSLKGKLRLIDMSLKENKKRRLSIGKGFYDSVLSLYESADKDSSSVRIVDNNDFGFYEVDILADGKKMEKVKISLNTDINEFIARERQPYTNKELSIDYSSVEKGFSIEFSKLFAADEIKIPALKDASDDLLPLFTVLSQLKKLVGNVSNNAEDVSNSWVKIPLRAVIKVVNGTTRPSVSSINGLPILSTAYLEGKKDDNVLYAVTPRTKSATDNDVIITTRGYSGSVGLVYKGADGILPPNLSAIKCNEERIITPRYLYYLIKGYEKNLQASAKGAAIKSLDTNSILDLKCLIPSVDEQKVIATYLDKVVGVIDEVLKSLGSTDNVFATYRQTLIENAVRGKIKIS